MKITEQILMSKGYAPIRDNDNNLIGYVKGSEFIGADMLNVELEPNIRIV